MGQSDTIKRSEGRDIRCQVTAITKQSVAYDLNGQPAQISAGEIQYIEFDDEPADIGRARLRLDNGQFADCLTELQKVAFGSLSPPLQAEHAYLRAKAETKKAMIDGTSTTREAATAVGEALRSFADSYHYYDLLNDFGTLAFHTGEMAVAEKSFQELASCGIPSFSLNGSLQLARVYLEQAKPAEAQEALTQVLQSSATDNFAQDAKLIARCLAARVQAAEGNADAGIAQIEQIIANEDSERKRVFASCYNSLGLCHLSLDDPRSARMDLLHTDLLYASEGDLHAEALYYLADIWTRLGETDRALRDKQILSQRYRNTYWANKK